MNLNKESGYKVMSRMEWFRDFKLIFNKLLKDEDIITPVAKMKIIKELSGMVSRLDLKDPEEYYKKSKVQAFTLAEILNHLNNLHEEAINFDQLIDSLIYLSIEKKRKDRKGALVWESRAEFENKKPKQNYIEVSEDQRIAPQFSQSLNTEGKIIRKSEFNDKNAFNAQSDYAHLIKPPARSSILDIAFPEKKLTQYPELKSHPNLLYLSLAGNSISHTKFNFPTSLIVLNLSSNRINELQFDNELPNLKLLNLTSNQLNRIFSVNQIKNIRELYLANNCITSANLFCHLFNLLLLDASHNEIEIFEDIAGLVISKRLGILKLRGNPLSSKPNYEKIVASILPSIYNFDPLNIIELSSFKSLGMLPFLPMRNLLEDTESFTITKQSMSSVKSEASIKVSSKTSSISEPSPIGRRVGPRAAKLSKSPIIPQRPACKVKRSCSQVRIERPTVMTNTTKTSVDYTEIEEPAKKGTELHTSSSIMDMAESRIKVYRGDQIGKSGVSLVSNKSIKNISMKVYGNPVAAMMIGPPAVSYTKNKVPAKSPANFRVDLAKKTRSK